MKKHLEEDEVANELRGGSLFFTRPRPEGPSKARPNVTLAPSPQEDMAPKGQGDNVSAHLGTKAPSHQPALHATAPADPERSLSEREYFRCTLEEVEAIEDVKTKLRRDLGIHTSKQDIERFAVRRAVEEYEELGERCHLVTVLRRTEKR